LASGRLAVARCLPWCARPCEIPASVGLPKLPGTGRDPERPRNLLSIGWSPALCAWIALRSDIVGAGGFGEGCSITELHLTRRGARYPCLLQIFLKTDDRLTLAYPSANACFDVVNRAFGGGLVQILRGLIRAISASADQNNRFVRRHDLVDLTTPCRRIGATLFVEQGDKLTSFDDTSLLPLTCGAQIYNGRPPQDKRP